MQTKGMVAHDRPSPRDSHAPHTLAQVQGPKRTVPSAAQAAMGLLSDPSLEVRRAASEFVSMHPQHYSSIPVAVFQQLFRERDGQVTSNLLSFVAAVPDGRGVVAPACIRLLADERPGIAIDAASALSEGRDIGRGAVIPLVVLGLVSARRQDPRVERSRRIDGADPEFREAIAQQAAQALSASERSHRTALKVSLESVRGDLTDEQVQALAIAVCSPGASVRSLALKALTAFGGDLTGSQRQLVWGALAFAMADYEHETCVAQHEFFGAICSSDMPGELAPMVESFRCIDDADVHMAHDFTVVSLSRHHDPHGAMERLAAMLWAQSPSTVGGAASNLVILLGDIDPVVGASAVSRLMEALVERAADGRAVVNKMVSAFGRLGSFHGEVLERSGELLARHQNPEVLVALARVLGAIPWQMPEHREIAGALLQALARMPLRRVSETAKYILNL